jgi:hypothetical protein
VMDYCFQATITGTTLLSLKGVTMLSMYGCSAATIAAAQSLGLPVLNRMGTLRNFTYTRP